MLVTEFDGGESEGWDSSSSSSESSESSDAFSSSSRERGETATDAGEEHGPVSRACVEEEVHGDVGENGAGTDGDEDHCRDSASSPLPGRQTIIEEGGEQEEQRFSSRQFLEPTIRQMTVFLLHRRQIDEPKQRGS